MIPSFLSSLLIRSETAAASPGTAAPPASEPESYTKTPRSWRMAVRPAMSGAVRSPEGKRLCEWQLIAADERLPATQESIGIAMFWWHATTTATEKAVAEIGPILKDGFTHGDHSAWRIAHLYERYGIANGPAHAIIKIGDMTIHRAIPDAEAKHFQNAIDALPDPELERKNETLETDRLKHEAAFDLTIRIDETPAATAVAVAAIPDTGSTVTVRTAPAPPAGEDGAASDDADRDEKLVAALTAELARMHMPLGAIAAAVDAWHSQRA